MGAARTVAAEVRVGWLKGFGAVILPMAVAIAVNFAKERSFVGLRFGEFGLWLGIASVAYWLLFILFYNKGVVHGEPVRTAITAMTISSTAMVANAAIQFTWVALGSLNTLSDKVIFYGFLAAVPVAALINVRILIRSGGPAWLRVFSLDCLIPWIVCIYHFLLSLKNVLPCGLVDIDQVVAYWTWPFYIANSLVIIGLLARSIRTLVDFAIFSGLGVVSAASVFFVWRLSNFLVYGQHCH